MKRIIAALGLMLPIAGFAQDYPHYTMFMYNKLMYNPAYAGSRDVTSVNATYRNQWMGIDGAPKNISLAVDGLVGNYTKEFRRVGLGLLINKENMGPVDNTMINAYYAYRIPMQNSTLAFGIQAGASLYSAKYSELNPLDQGDDLLAKDIKNSILPNVGFGAYWNSKRAYIGLSAPNILENYYDKSEPVYANGKKARQIRSYFLSGGYSFALNENTVLMPQAIVRYNKDSKYELPLNVDINASLIFYHRFLIGITYRTDKSLEGIVHVQVAKKFNIGYAYDYSMSDFSQYAKGTHEVTVGFDFIHDRKDFADPRFIKNF